MKTRVFVPIALLLFLACAPVTTTVTLLGQKQYPSRPTDCEIQILTQAPTNRKYEELAILNTVTYGAQQKDLNAMLPSIKATACGLGADAILIKNLEVGESAIMDSTSHAYTVAIKFID